MQSKATTVEQYLKELPEDRREAISAIRKVILASIDEGVKEGMQYGMIGYYIPHSVYPAGYHCDPKQPLPYVCVASQKNHLAVYMMSIYGSGDQENWFRTAWEKTGKKLDMGKSCIRFRKIEDAALEVIGEAIRRFPSGKYIKYYEEMLMGNRKPKSAARPQRKPKQTQSSSKKGGRRETRQQKSSEKNASQVIQQNPPESFDTCSVCRRQHSSHRNKHSNETVPRVPVVPIMRKGES